MKHRLCLIMLLLVSSTFAQETKSLVFSKPHVGFVKDNKYTLSFNFGIEQWEEGKQSKVYSQWFLDCNSHDPLSGAKKNTCNLEEIKLDTRWAQTAVTSIKKSTEDGDLTIRKVDWQSGILDFAVHYLLSENPLEVRIRFLREDNTLYLDSFKGIQLTRGVFADVLTSVELRVPEYDYMVQVPIEMRGMKSDLIRRHEQLETLSPADKAIWKKLEKSREFFSILENVRANREKILPGWDGKRSLTEAEQEKLKRVIYEDFQTRLRGAGVSPEGQKKILDYLTALFIKG